MTTDRPDLQAMTTSELQAYARARFSSIARLRQRQRLIRAITSQEAKQNNT